MAEAQSPGLGMTNGYGKRTTSDQLAPNPRLRGLVLLSLPRDQVVGG